MRCFDHRALACRPACPLDPHRPHGEAGRRSWATHWGAPGALHFIIPSQFHLERPSLIEKLKAGDLKLVVFIHYIIRTLFSHYFTEEDADLYYRRIKSAARLADVIIVNSKSTTEAFRSRFGESSTAGAPVVAPLGIESPAQIEPPPALPRQAHFVMLGTIAPSKNHRLILELWLELHRELGASTPHLLVIGERG